MLSLALVMLSSSSELKLEVLGALAGFLKPITFSVRCIFGGKLICFELPKTSCACRGTGGGTGTSKQEAQDQKLAQAEDPLQYCQGPV